MNNTDKIIEIFCSIDDFNKVFINELRTYQLEDKKRQRNRAFTLNESEIMTIVV
jgi:hypothetical protein